LQGAVRGVADRHGARWQGPLQTCTPPSSGGPLGYTCAHDSERLRAVPNLKRLHGRTPACARKYPCASQHVQLSCAAGRGRGTTVSPNIRSSASRPTSFFDFITQEQVDTNSSQNTTAPLALPTPLGTPHFAAQLDASSVASSAAGGPVHPPPPPIPISINPQLLRQVRHAWLMRVLTTV
jgi:hypothetical protein